MMKARGTARYPSLGRLLEKAAVPKRSVGIFWLGGLSVAFKSAAGLVYVADPNASDQADGPVGAIDVRPDLVICSLAAPEGLDLSTLTYLASAYPEAQFVAGETGRDWMIGRMGHAELDEVPVNPNRVHVQDADTILDVRRLSLQDAARVHLLPDFDGTPDGPRDVVFSFSGIYVCLIRGNTDLTRLARVRASFQPRIDILLWPLGGKDPEVERKGVALFQPRYVVPIGHDLLNGGRGIVRRFREVMGEVSGVSVYLFPEDYLEGLVYSRIMSRQKN